MRRRRASSGEIAFGATAVFEDTAQAGRCRLTAVATAAAPANSRPRRDGKYAFAWWSHMGTGPRPNLRAPSLHTWRSSGSVAVTLSTHRSKPDQLDRSLN